MTADELWKAWVEASTSEHPVEAKAHAETLLDIMLIGFGEPSWKARDRRAFLNWCDREGLIVRGLT